MVQTIPELIASQACFFKVRKSPENPHYGCYSKKCVIANGVSCGSLRPPPMTNRVNELKFNFDQKAKIAQLMRKPQKYFQI